MKTTKICVLVSLLAVLFTGCSTVSVQYDYDTSVDFSSLNTYNWLTIPENANINQLNVKRFVEAMEAQLAAKGYTLVEDDPDFLIASHYSTQEKVDVVDWGYGYGAYDSYWGGAWGPGGGVEAYQYDEGTLIVDFIDTLSKNMIWRGTAQAVVAPESTPEKQQQRINGAVQQILGSFPPPSK